MESVKPQIREEMWKILTEARNHPEVFYILRLHDMVEERIWNNMWNHIYDQVDENK